MASVIAKTYTPRSSADNGLRNHPCPDPGSGVHSWIQSAAGSLKKIGLAVDEASELIAANIPAGRLRPKEISDILGFIYGQSGDAPRRREPPKLPLFEPVTLAKAVSGIPLITREWLRKHSPESVDVGPAGFLKAIYSGEHVGLVIGDDDSASNVIWRRLEHVWDDSECERPACLSTTRQMECRDVLCIKSYSR
jgi:hypothetical protein